MRFGCTMCGRCCHGLRLPLSVTEALEWIDTGGIVELLCDAAPDMPTADAAAAHRHARSFSARSGAMAISVHLLLTATFAGPCPNLLPDFACRRYATRPAACRIYPAEINPTRRLDPADKLCPPEAWSADQPALLRDDGAPADAALAATLSEAREAAVNDAAVKAHLPALLELNAAALANEGFVIWRPAQPLLRSALAAALADPAPPALPDFHFVTNRASTADLIRESSAHVAPPPARADMDYLPFFPAET